MINKLQSNFDNRFNRNAEASNKENQEPTNNSFAEQIQAMRASILAQRATYDFGDLGANNAPKNIKA